MRTRIAAFLNDIGPVVLSRSNQKNLFGIVLEGSELERYAKKYYAGPLITIKTKTSSPPSDNDVLDNAILHTNLLKQLKNYHITAVLVPAQSSSRLITTWARENNLILLQVPHTLQRRLEDKIQFDALMRTWHVSVPPLVPAQSLRLHPRSTIVIQGRGGCGGSSTKIKMAADVRHIRSTHNTLIRKYMNGVPYGVSIVMDGEGNYFCSAVRRQCFVMKKNGSPQLLGLQWIPTVSLTPTALRAVEHMVGALVRVLLDQGFIGVANIDFILSNNKSYVLECNPRFSGATPHVFSKESLTPHPDPWNFLLNAFLGEKNRPIHTTSIPQSAYCGALTYIDAEKKCSVFGTVPIHSYVLGKGSVLPTTGKKNESFFLLYELPRKTTVVKKGETICYILCDDPLFTSRGQPTSKNNELRAACLAMFHPHAAPSS